MQKMLCIGAGHVGGPSMAVIARHCPEYRVDVVDIDAERIAAWQSDDLPIYEPGLLAVVKDVRGRGPVLRAWCASRGRLSYPGAVGKVCSAGNFTRRPSGGPARERSAC